LYFAGEKRILCYDLRPAAYNAGWCKTHRSRVKYNDTDNLIYWRSESVQVGHSNLDCSGWGFCDSSQLLHHGAPSQVHPNVEVETTLLPQV